MNNSEDSVIIASGTVSPRNDENALRVFVGTESRMWRAERALEYSIRRHASGPVEIIWMDRARGGDWSGWDIGRDPECPASTTGWYTDFSNFRMAVPEVAGFRGLALYLDVDMLLLGDVYTLAGAPLDAPVVSPMLSNGRPDTSLMLVDCTAFRDLTWWPRLGEMKSNKWPLRKYVGLLAEYRMVAAMDSKWYSVDGEGFSTSSLVLHFSNMETQPWTPYEDRYQYLAHPRSDLVSLWWQSYARAIECDL